MSDEDTSGRTSNADAESEERASSFYEAYEGHSKLLRTWLVAYGIGTPVIFLTNDSLWQTLAQSGYAAKVGTLFLTGVGLQVLLATVNKTVMWALYFGEVSPRFKQKWLYRLADGASESFWLDMLVDVITIVFFVLATICTFQVVVHAT
jgi:hypothetical protein